LTADDSIKSRPGEMELPSLWSSASMTWAAVSVDDSVTEAELTKYRGNLERVAERDEGCGSIRTDIARGCLGRGYGAWTTVSFSELLAVGLTTVAEHAADTHQLPSRRHVIALPCSVRQRVNALTCTQASSARQRERRRVVNDPPRRGPPSDNVVTSWCGAVAII
jgi:hypothetical protein